MITEAVRAPIDEAAEDTKTTNRRRFREIHRQAEQAAQAVLDAHDETAGRTFEGRSFKPAQRPQHFKGIEQRIIEAAILRPALLQLNGLALLRELEQIMGFPIPRHYLRNPLKKKPTSKGRDPYWYIVKLRKLLASHGIAGLHDRDLVNVQAVLDALRSRLLPPPDNLVFKAEIAFTADGVTIGKRQYRLHSTTSGRLRIRGDTANLPAEALFEILKEATGANREASWPGKALP